ncbi:MAG: WYL domain-containing protein [Opitutales bacterium]|nr:WYL domain-containing protein [Opitutales bacterium]
MSSGEPSWSERARLCFVERLLFWRGYINRRDLMKHFRISAPQATNDLVTYTTLAPGNCAYNVRSKRYEAAAGMAPVLVEPDFGRDMEATQTAAWPEGAVDFVARAERPPRVASTEHLRALALAAHRRESVEVRYFSISSGKAAWRRISPRTFGHDGLRWHVRAYCHGRGEFRDFVVGRMKGVRSPAPCPVADTVDREWTKTVVMEIEPAPDLDANRRKALEMDYGMKRGRLRLPVTMAMLTYTARRFGFVGDWREPDALPMLNELKELVWTAVTKEKHRAVQ